MNTESTDKQIREDFYNLVHYQFGGDLHNVEQALSRHPNRRVSVRTIQSWLVKGDRPSKRTCPDWGPTLLREYLEEHPERMERGRSLAHQQRSTSHQTGLGSKYADRVNIDGNAMADRRIEEEMALEDKLASAAFHDMPKLVAQQIGKLKREYEGLSQTLHTLLQIINDADETTSVYDLKKQLSGERLLWAAGASQLNNTQRDIIERRAEFASEDGTLAKET